MACKYPNFAAEMARFSVDYGSLYEEIGAKFDRSAETVSNWLTGTRGGELPTNAAFAIRDTYFPNAEIGYLFSTEPICPWSQ